MKTKNVLFHICNLETQYINFLTSSTIDTIIQDYDFSSEWLCHGIVFICKGGHVNQGLTFVTQQKGKRRKKDSVLTNNDAESPQKAGIT